MSIKLAVAFILGCVGVPANAATMKAQWTGSIYNSYNETGMFGTSGFSSLDGLQFALTITYDTARGTKQNQSNYSSVSGGAFFGKPSPITLASMTVNGVTETVNGSDIGTVTQDNSNFSAFGYSSFYQGAQDFFRAQDGSGYTRAISIQLLGLLGSIPTSLNQPFALSAVQTFFPTAGTFNFTNYDATLGRYTYSASGSLAATNVVVTSVPSAVPIPASGLMLVAAISAFGLGAIRKRVAS